MYSCTNNLHKNNDTKCDIAYRGKQILSNENFRHNYMASRDGTVWTEEKLPCFSIFFIDYRKEELQYSAFGYNWSHSFLESLENDEEVRVGTLVFSVYRGIRNKMWVWFSSAHVRIHTYIHMHMYIHTYIYMYVSVSCVCVYDLLMMTNYTIESWMRKSQKIL